jgi:hypothetical protein
VPHRLGVSLVRDLEVIVVLGLNKIFDGEAIAMRKRTMGVLVVAAGLLCTSLPLFAHHGNATLDTTKTLTLKGTVTEWLWSNPHCLLQFDVKNESAVKNGNLFGRITLVVLPDGKTFVTVKEGVTPKYAIGSSGGSKPDNSNKQ